MGKLPRLSGEMIGPKGMGLRVYHARMVQSSGWDLGAAMGSEDAASWRAYGPARPSGVKNAWHPAARHSVWEGSKTSEDSISIASEVRE
jgi:hypothetical protein